MKANSLSRRDFIKLAGVGTGGLVLAIYLDGCAPGTLEPATALPTIPPTLTGPTSTPTETPTPGPAFDWQPNLYIKLDNRGILTVTACRSEMGQGIRTALAMLAAEELDVGWANVRIEQALADNRYGNQVTGGSVSVSTFYSIMRTAGAKARAMLLDAASQAWNVDASRCTTEPGFVVHPDGQQKLPYAALVEKAAALKLPATAPLKDESRFRIVGTDIGHWDASHIVTGQAVYGIDVRLPGMLFAVIARCPVFGRGYTAYDDSAALAVGGVRQVVALRDRIAVVADNTWSAIQGRNALKITWDDANTASLNSDAFIQSTLDRLPKPGSAPSGSIDAIYTIPYEAHATMEPMNCTANVHNGICEVWAPTQSPQDVQGAVANALGLSRNKVTVNVTLLGGGFGRRLQTDYAEEAARVSQAIAAPVQVIWTRADDLQNDFYHPMQSQYFQASLSSLRRPSARQTADAASRVPTGAWRSVENFPEAYGIQCFLGELAAALNRDPLDVWLEVYAGRAAAVIRLAAEKVGWGSALPNGQGRGLAYHASFGVTHVAMVAEVEGNSAAGIRVRRMVAAVDCGRVVNPDNVIAQIEGGIAFGLTAAIKAQATFKDGRIQQGNFDDYPILRMDEMPVVEVNIIPSESVPSGIGEMGVPPVAPAVANAVFMATGKRVRRIPILTQMLY